MSDPRFSKLADSNVRVFKEPSEEPAAVEPNVALAMHSTAKSNAVQNVLIPELKARIAEYDAEEGNYLGTAKAYEFRGRRLEAMEMLERWQKWSGQAPSAPDEEK